VAKVIDELKSDGVNIAHYDMIFMKPLDDDLLNEVCKKFKKVITVEDGTIHGGFGTAVIAWMNNNCHAVKIQRIGVPDEFIHQGSIDELRKQCGMDNESIKRAIFELKEEKL